MHSKFWEICHLMTQRCKQIMHFFHVNMSDKSVSFKCQILRTELLSFPDLTKLYNSEYMDPNSSPLHLQNKVQFDIRYYFCCRGGENIHDMTKDTFQVEYNAEMGIAYVKKWKMKKQRTIKKQMKQLWQDLCLKYWILKQENHTSCVQWGALKIMSTLNPKTNHLWQQTH